MELDDLKKSWNAFDEHLKNKEFIKDEEITGLIARARNRINNVSRFNRKLRYISLAMLGLIVAVSIHSGKFPDIYLLLLFILCIPSIGWDLYTARYLDNTNIEEMPLVTVIGRINRYHRWLIREQIAGILFIIMIATAFFLQKHIWHTLTGTLVYLVTWGVALCVILWIYRSHIGRIKEIKKNLAELEELNR